MSRKPAGAQLLHYTSAHLTSGCPPPNKEIDRCTTEAPVYACPQRCFVSRPRDARVPIMVADQTAAIPTAAQPLWQETRVAEVRKESLARPAAKAFRTAARVDPRSHRAPADPHRRRTPADPRNHPARADPRNRRAPAERRARTPPHLTEVVVPLPQPAPSQDRATLERRAAEDLPSRARAEIATVGPQGARQQEEAAEKPLAAVQQAEAQPVGTRPVERPAVEVQLAAVRAVEAPARHRRARSSANAASTSARSIRWPSIMARR